MSTHQVLDPQLYGYIVEVVANDYSCKNRVGEIVKMYRSKAECNWDRVSGLQADDLTRFIEFQDLEGAIIISRGCYE